MNSFLIIGILIVVLIIIICIAVAVSKSNRKLRKDIEEIKNTSSTIINKEREYEKIKENFTSGDDDSNVDATLDFLQNHKRDGKD